MFFNSFEQLLAFHASRVCHRLSRKMGLSAKGGADAVRKFVEKMLMAYTSLMRSPSTNCGL